MKTGRDEDVITSSGEGGHELRRQIVGADVEYGVRAVAGRIGPRHSGADIFDRGRIFLVSLRRTLVGVVVDPSAILRDGHEPEALLGKDRRKEISRAGDGHWRCAVEQVDVHRTVEISVFVVLGFLVNRHAVCLLRREGEIARCRPPGNAMQIGRAHV